MIGLSDIINLIWVDGDKPIRIITANGETPQHQDGDPTEELESTWQELTSTMILQKSSQENKHETENKRYNKNFEMSQ